MSRFHLFLLKTKTLKTLYKKGSPWFNDHLVSTFKKLIQSDRILNIVFMTYSYVITLFAGWQRRFVVSWHVKFKQLVWSIRSTGLFVWSSLTESCCRIFSFGKSEFMKIENKWNTLLSSLRSMFIQCVFTTCVYYVKICDMWLWLCCFDVIFFTLPLWHMY